MQRRKNRIENNSESPKSGEGQASPDFVSWEDLREVPKSIIAVLLRALGRGTLPELVILLAMVGLFYLGRDLIASAGGVPSAPVLACVVALAVLSSALVGHLACPWP